jgi:hypothetical protein
MTLSEEERISRTRERKRRWNAEHEDKCRAAAEKYYETHKEVIKQRRQENHLHIKERSKRYYENHKEKILADHREWRRQHRTQIMEMSDEEFLIAAGLRKPREP